MKTSDFDYYLPKDLIAQTPAKNRDQSRLMVLDPLSQTIQHKKFSNIIDYLFPGDLLVMNDTKVIPANLVGRKEEGTARIEVLLLRKEKRVVRSEERGEKIIYECLVKPGKRLKVGSRIIFGAGEMIGEVLEKKEGGEQIIEFTCEGRFREIIEKLGQIPLPPYIRPQTTDHRPQTLEKRYQTVYAREEGAVAAPTAGLHFTPHLLKKIERKGIEIAYLTLHTGIATFRPVLTENLEEHPMHREQFFIPEATREAVKKAKRVVAAGTTTVRALESDQRITNESTNLFIYPGYKFKVVDAMITNFHFPRSTLLMMVSAFAQWASADKSAFAGREFILQAYAEAIRLKYRFFSFGDAMLIFGKMN